MSNTPASSTAPTVSASKRHFRRTVASVLVALLAIQLVGTDTSSALDLSKYRKWDFYERVGTSSILTSGSQADLMYVKMSDYWLQDAPGILTTTAHIHGYSRTYVNSADATGVTSTRLVDRFTCSGAHVSSVSLSASGVSISGGVTSRTAEWDSSNSHTSSSAVFKSTYHYYRDSGMFHCKVPNLPAKMTHGATGYVRRSGRDYSGAASWSRWW